MNVDAAACAYALLSHAPCVCVVVVVAVYDDDVSSSSSSSSQVYVAPFLVRALVVVHVVAPVEVDGDEGDVEVDGGDAVV